MEENGKFTAKTCYNHLIKKWCNLLTQNDDKTHLDTLAWKYTGILAAMHLKLYRG